MTAILFLRRSRVCLDGQSPRSGVCLDDQSPRSGVCLDDQSRETEL
jgi:hypothetical protein